MNVIHFYDYGIEDIITGRKHSTLRFNEDQFREGSIVEVRRNSDEHIGRIRIQRKTKVLFSELDEQDALVESWGSLDALKKRLLHTYPHLTPESVLTRYEFAFLADSIHERKRGSNADLTKYLPSKISVITSSDSKAERYVWILKKLPLALSEIKAEKYSQPLEFENDASAESRAIAKTLSLKHRAKDRFYLSTDDMGLLEVRGRCLPIPNLRSFQDEYLPMVRDRARLTIRTAIAISHQSRCNTTIVYRSFYLDPKAASRPRRVRTAMPLNSFLFLDQNRRQHVADLPITHPLLVEPLAKGILDCFRGTAP